MQRIPLLVLRFVQLLSAAVVLGTSAHLVGPLQRLQDLCNAIEKNSLCNLYGLIPAIGFGCFVGALGLLVALVGFAAGFVDAIPETIMLAADGLVSVVFLAGGIALAVILGKPIYQSGSSSMLTEAKADCAFQFIGGLVSIALVVLGFMWRGRSKGSSSV